MSPDAVAPYFVVVALIHAAAVATRFDALAAKLPPGVATAVMIAQFPLLLLSGFFEGKLDYGPNKVALPLWMRIKSVPVPSTGASSSAEPLPISPHHLPSRRKLRSLRVDQQQRSRPRNDEARRERLR